MEIWDRIEVAAADIRNLSGGGSRRCETCNQEEGGPPDIFSDVQSVR
jgi:hypothetical protein